MDTLAKETMGLPIFICPTNHQIISSGGGSTNAIPATSSGIRPLVTDSAAAATPTSPTNSTQYSPTTSFFATATATRSPTTQTFSPTSAATATPHNTRRNTYTYTPPTFSSPRRESLLSTHRLSAAFDFASTFAVEVLSKAADQVFGNEEGRAAEAGMQLWGEDLEAGGKEREKGRYNRFGEEGAFESWLD